MALIEKLNAIGDAIREKTGKTELLTLDEMPTEIGAIETGGGGGDLPEEALVITGNCQNKFGYGGWDWFIENYGDKVTTEDISDANYMFYYSQVEEIPFELNFLSTSTSDMGYMFARAMNLKSVPKINNCKPSATDNLFYGCNNLREIPEDIESWFDWSYIDSLTSGYSGSRAFPFQSCCSLRSIPMDFLAHGNPVISYSKSIYYNGFNSCYALDEIVDLPNPHLNATWTGNAFYNTFSSCFRLKNLTFKMPDGAPYVVNWKSQTIDLSSNVGWATTTSYLTGYNSGITEAMHATNDTTYQALKDDPDWFTCNPAYSRYNHDSAVATINSLPDTSAYLATAGGTNTIKFKGAAGSATDGGAINTLTEEEIAVATAKGWTVTLV